MSVATEAPMTVTPHAAAWIEGLGVQSAFDQIAARIRERMPGLRAIEVTLEPPCPEHGTSECILVTPIRDEPEGTADDPTGRELSRWLVENFPLAISEHFCILPGYLPRNER